MNRIFENYYNDFPLSPNHVLKDINKIYKNLLHDDAGKRIVKKIVEEFSKDIMKDSIENYSKKFDTGEQFKFKMNHSNAEIFSQLEEASYFQDFAPRSGEAFYLKIIFESYVVLPRAERQKIYYKEEISTLQNAISSNHKIQIKLEDDIIVVTPYKLTIGIDQNNYFIEYIKPMEDRLFLEGAVDFDPNSINLNRILDVKAHSPMNDTEKATLKMLNDVELQVNIFSHHNSAKNKFDVKVKFSENGKRRFNLEEDNSIIIGLPVKSEKNTYLFKATESEIFWEIFKYGADAEIIEPAFLREKFMKFYELAAKIYSIE